ncbi:MAG: DUF5063 domain-containing protein [Gammaproteobacteria bacterium]|nr:DUF5063 domain-containing protein [Gammaproteobacteria bacterium]
MNNRPTSTLKGMAYIAREYCALIENLETNSIGDQWIRSMGRILPKLHTAIVLLETPEHYSYSHQAESDDVHCELFMKLNDFFLSDHNIWPDFDKDDVKCRMCESLAYDFTDMYFDLKHGLELLDLYPNQPSQAACNWRASFYYHWGRQLVDAEGWLYAVGVRGNHANTTGLAAQTTSLRMA